MASKWKAANVLRWTARILGLPVTVLFLFWYTWFGAGSILTDLHGAITAYLIPPILFGAMVLAGYLLSWWHDRAGGALLILASIGLMVNGIIQSSAHIPSGWSTSKIIINDLRGWTVPGGPLFAIGVLFVFSGWLTERSTSGDKGRVRDSP